MSPESKAKNAKPSAAAKAGAKARAKAADKKSNKKAAASPDATPAPAPAEAAAAPYQANPKPQLTEAQRVALGVRRQKDEARPAFRRHEWWRYKRLGGKHAPWRLPRGIHSKVRRHFKHRPPLVSIGYRGPEAVRGLHPSGFEEVLVHNEADVARLNKDTQAARVGGTVGGRKAKLIEAAADKLGVRVLNRRVAA
ncbi:MAG TPA: 50S ribosomal protein L32e [Candidatus Thermoplasmatota archaeon]|nr:50S ribosomal protein L32e [Candidatus Thermoplasmatota archaeon]